MDHDFLFTEPHPLGEQPVPVHSQRLRKRKVHLGSVLVEPAPARHQLVTTRRAWLHVATRMVPATVVHTAVAAPRTTRSTGVVAVRPQVEATTVPMESVDIARDGGRHLAMAPVADGHHTTPGQLGSDHGQQRRPIGTFFFAQVRLIAVHVAAPWSIDGSDGDSGPEAQHGAAGNVSAGQRFAPSRTESGGPRISAPCRCAAADIAAKSGAPDAKAADISA